MKTELVVNDPKIEPGKKIQCDKYQVRHFRLHKVLETLARLQLFTLESRSNNTAAISTSQDARTIQKAFALAQVEWASAKTRKAGPTGTLERVYHIIRPTPSELQAVQNMKMKSLALEIDHLMEIIIACDSSQLDVYVGDSSQNDIDEVMGQFKLFVDQWVGDGQESSDSTPEAPKYNTGLDAPEGFRILGEIIPDVDLDLASAQEPSKDVQPARAPDVADVDG